MARCSMCGFSFPRLDDATSCQKCQSRIPGLSGPELHAINAKTQCASCGIMWSGMNLAICNACITFYRSEKSLPRELIFIQGLAQALFGMPQGGVNDPEVRCNDSHDGMAATVLELAQARRRDASNTRFTAGPPKTIGSTSVANKHNNLNKANEVTAERRQKRAEANLRDSQTGVLIVASVWEYIKGKQAEVKPGIHVQRTFGNDREIKLCLDELLKMAKNDYEKLNNCNKPALTWENILLYAHQGSTTKYASLSHIDKTLTIKDLFCEFKEQRYATEAGLKSRAIEIRFVIHNREELEYENLESFAPSSKRKRTLSSIKPGSITKSAPTPSNTKSALPSARFGASQKTDGKITLKSAFRRPQAKFVQPSTRWTRTPPMVAHKFTRVTATFGEDGSVSLIQSKDKAMIELAADWENGETASKNNKPFTETGYIGRGGTKRAIYARFGGMEYAVTQHFDDETTAAEVFKNLSGEYELLAQCHWFKEKFDEHAAAMEATTIPEFYFNFPGSILGEILPSVDFPGRILPFSSFLATPLLPCGEVDAPVRKFTGNDLLGPASDRLTQAVHAFVHFSFVYSGDYLFFCDLQGTRDVQGKMCLFDPQAHTNRARSSLDNQYWDLGKKTYRKLVNEHMMACSGNWVCKQLKLADIVLERQESEKCSAMANALRVGMDSQLATRRNRMNVIELLND